MEINRRFTAYHLSVGPSKIERRGVFSMTSIPARHKVVEYAGEKVTLRVALQRVAKILKGKGPKRLYLARVNRNWVIDGAFGGSGAEFINHSCSPNLYPVRAKGKIHFYSLRRVRKGEELTVDYRYDPSHKPIRCKCGSKNCRGTINLPMK